MPSIMKWHKTEVRIHKIMLPPLKLMVQKLRKKTQQKRKKIRRLQIHDGKKTARLFLKLLSEMK